MNFITYQEALAVIEDNLHVPKKTSISIEEAHHHVLNEDLVADRDFPPFDRVTMDGIAIAFESFKNGRRKFRIQETIAAGTPQSTLKNVEDCIEIMTGAMMPVGADTVIRYEDLEMNDGYATITEEGINEKQNVHFQAEDRKQNEVIVKKGVFMESAELNIAASVGKTKLDVLAYPKALVVSTGDELVDIDKTPEPHQIRRSNLYGIRAMLEKWNIHCELLHLPDDPDFMKTKLEEALKDFDMLVLTGGVSKGKFDYLPSVLEDLGVQKLFHKIQQRPGKPFWFGKAPHDTTVFALPGNPVSSFMCLTVYIRQWLNKSMGLSSRKVFATLTNDVEFKPDLFRFLECKTSYSAKGELMADPIVHRQTHK
jgi:molybdopterin molybdotransferase